MWVLGLVLGILLLGVLLLAVPVDLIFLVERDEEFRSKFRVGWLFGVIGKDIRGRKKPKKEKPKKPKKKRPIKPVLAMMRSRGFLRRLLRLGGGVIRSSKVRELKADVRLGLGDPAETGLAFAVIGPSMALLRSFTACDVRVEPDFEQQTFRGYLKGDLRIVPLRMMVLFTLFALSPTTLRAIKALVVARRK